MLPCIRKAVATVAAAFFFLMPALSHAQEISLISDEETEALLEKIVKPLFAAAGLPYNRNEVHLVNDPTLNAFVADGNHLFIHTGTILNASSPNELAGVIAHETGHIQGGHILRQKLKNQSLQEVGLVSAILAGTAAAVSGRGDVAMAAMLGSQSSMLTNYLQYRTGEERAADEAALALLNKTKQSPAGMLAFMKKISRQNQMSGLEESPYFRTHPVTTERIRFFEQAAAQNKFSEQSSLQPAFDRVKAKLYAYLSSPEQTLRAYPQKSIPALYAQSIAFFKQLRFDRALQTIDRLIATEPKNPFFYELKAQIYLETGKIAPARENYYKALSLMPSSALLQISYAQALLEDATGHEQTTEAITLLNKALLSRPGTFAWMLLARAYGENGDMAGANYAAAEYSYRLGQYEAAKGQLKSAAAANPSKQMKLKIDDLNNRLKQIADQRARS